MRPFTMWDIETDVVVLGAGGAGLLASIEAAKAGASVMLLESRPAIGGSSAICGGGVAFAGTDIQQEMGIEDSNQLLYNDFMEAGKQRNVREMVKTYVDHQLDTYYLLKKLGVKFLPKVSMAEGSVARAHNANPAEVIRLLGDEARRLGVKTLLKTPGARLIADSSKRVIGVNAKRANKDLNIKARRGVVVATGGFSRNPGLLEDFRVGFSKVKPISGLGSYGDGFRMLCEQGARLKDMASLKATFSHHPESSPGRGFPGYMYWAGAIIINRAGRRFVNEGLGHKEIPEYVLRQPDPIVFQIFDSKIAKEATNNPLNIRSLQQKCVMDNSVEGLAKKIRVPANVLKETVTQYNRCVAIGKDAEFGREGLSGKLGTLVSIDTPPFYAFESACVMVGTYCGADVDNHGHVINVYGERIPGLYAAGEVTGGLHGDGYIAGTAFGKALIFGRISGKNAAAEEPWE